MTRIFIYPKDISEWMGLTIRMAQYFYSQTKAALKKEKHQRITKREFALYMCIDEDELIIT
ncbi:hypothetical protein [Pedobacter sp.]|uniref:hypothetical protein n=1 Tax=Pedobacter sp. TaxID=1411316 RepID=UPI003D7F3A24